jgi:hypothetical protein
MKADTLAETLGWKKFLEIEDNHEIEDAYTSDLMSDVIANAPEEALLITIQAHNNTIAAASLAGMNAVLLCNNRTPGEDMFSAARREGLSLYGTDKNQFQASYLVAKTIKKSGE